MAAPPKRKRESPPVPRAILFTDIVGSTRYFSLHGDQAGMHMLDVHNCALFPLIEQANGRVVKTIGDSIMAVFAQPVDAMRAAFALQQCLEGVRATLPEQDRIHIRVGAHYGLVMEKDDDVFGDTVNLAERVKSSAEADQVFVSRALRDLVRTDPRFSLSPAGFRELKGAAEPVELFHLTRAPELPKRSLLKRWTRRAGYSISHHPALVAMVVLLAVLIAAGWWWRSRPAVTNAPEALAVMPFRNLKNDDQVQYLSGALPQELNTQFQTLGTVIVRPYSSVQQYQGKDWNIATVAQELQVNTIITGSFMRDGDNLRVNVEIVDARRNRQLWAQLFPGAVGDVLQLLDQVSHKVASALRLRMRSDEQAFRYGTQDARAYDLYLRGLFLQQEIKQENNLAAIDVLEQAVALDANFARAHAALADAYATHYWWNFSNDTVWLDKAEGSARRALSIDSNLAEAHFALAHALEGKGKRADFLRENLASLRANHRYLPALVNFARYSFYMGDFDRALTVLDRIAEIDPTQNVQMRKAVYLYFAGQLPSSRFQNQKAEQRAQGVDELTQIGTTYVWLGELDSAERVVKRLEQLQPGYSGAAEIRASLFTARGQVAEARNEMEKFALRRRTSWGIAQLTAALYATQGDSEQALAELEKAVALGGPSYAWFKSDTFRSLRGNPRYEATLKKLADEYQPLHAEFDQILAETAQ
ncbi:MAG: adenylate/guanylate cyclase domain-containing protein [bacterium]